MFKDQLHFTYHYVASAPRIFLITQLLFLQSYSFEERERSAAESHSDYGGSGDEAQMPSGLDWQTGSYQDEVMLKSMSHSGSFKKHPDEKCDGDRRSDGARLVDYAGPSNLKGKPFNLHFL